jgi:hypothetical protein
LPFSTTSAARTVRPIHTAGLTESRNQQGVDRWQQGRAYALAVGY